MIPQDTNTETQPQSILTHKQVRTRTRVYTEGETRYRAVAEIRFDDEFHNGHNTFKMTCDVYQQLGNGRWVEDSGGCRPDLVAHLWPDLAPFLKWHLCSTEGPQSYLANTLYHASDKDFDGLRKGEPTGFRLVIHVGNSPITQKPGNDRFRRWLRDQWESGKRLYYIESVHHPREPKTFKPKYTFAGYRGDAIKWHECPFDTWDEADEWRRAIESEVCLTFTEVPHGYSEGKEPDLEAARRSAIWPDATLAQLQDRDALKARLPALLAEFRRDIESLGFVW